MHVVTVVKRQGSHEYRSTLVRTSYREGGKVKKRTLANLSHLPAATVEVVRRSLMGETLVGADERLVVERSWPHGHVAAALGTARQLGLVGVLDPRPSRQRDLALAMVVARVLEPASKLATSQLWDTTSLARSLGVENADEAPTHVIRDGIIVTHKTSVLPDGAVV